MQKPEKSIKKRKAANARGQKRSARAAQTLANKHQRKEAARLKKKADDRKFQEHLNKLMPQF